ncbi:PapB/FocB family fimbrial expression transcriptional regulator, partial [Yokenella regensburgei]
MDKLNYLNYGRPGTLRSGSVHPEHFRLLIDLSGMQSVRVIQAMED